MALETNKSKSKILNPFGFVFRLLFSDLPAKLISFLMASVLWLIASGQAIYEYQTTVPLLIEGIPDNLLLMSELPKELEVKLEGRGSELFQLNFGQEPAILYLNNMKPDSSIQTISVQNVTFHRVYDIRLLDIIKPTSFYLELDKIKSKKIRIDVPQRGSLLSNLVLKETISWTPNRVEISGPSRIIDTIQVFATDTLDLSQIAGDTEVFLRLAVNKALPLVKFMADSIKVKVKVEQLLAFEYTHVAVVLEGDSGAFDYNPKNVRVKVLVPESKSRPYKEIVSEEIKAFVSVRRVRDDEMSLPIQIRAPDALFNNANFEPEYILVTRKKGR